MWKRILGKLWRKSPGLIKVRLVRALQAKFTASVGAIVTDPDGKILLLDHVLRPGVGWGIPGGFIEKNEQPQDAVQRELCEEIGLKLEDIRLVSVRTIERHIEIMFRARAVEKGEVKSFEINEIGWFALDQMPAKFSRKQKTFIEEILAAERRGESSRGQN